MTCLAFSCVLRFLIKSQTPGSDVYYMGTSNGQKSNPCRTVERSEGVAKADRRPGSRPGRPPVTVRTRDRTAGAHQGAGLPLYHLHISGNALPRAGPVPAERRRLPPQKLAVPFARLCADHLQG